MTAGAPTATISDQATAWIGGAGGGRSALFRSLVAKAMAGIKEFGPYAAIELILPGGSLLAIGLWLYRRYQTGVAKRATA